MLINKRKKYTIYNRLARFFDQWGDREEKQINRHQAKINTRLDSFDNTLGCKGINPKNLYRFM